MARYTLKNIKTSVLRETGLFCCRYKLCDESLLKSMKRVGILMPLLVMRDRPPQVLAGHKRLAAAKKLKISTLPILETHPLQFKEAFLLGLVSNWRQNFSEMDRAKAIGMAWERFRFSADEMCGIILPLLGLSGEPRVVEWYRKIDRFPDSLKDLIEDRVISFRGAMALADFGKTDQMYLAKVMSTQVKLTSSQLIQASEWLADLMRESDQDLKGIFKKHGFLKELGHAAIDPRTKADKLFEAVKQARFPGVLARLSVFEKKRAGILSGIREVRVEPVEGFEENGFELRARIKNPKDLERILRTLSKKSEALNSLFDVML